LIDGVHLRLAALIAPDERRPDDGASLIENHQSVHLAGKTDAAHLGAGNTGFGQRAAYGDAGGVPPILGTLLGPQRALHPDIFMDRRETRGDAALRVYHQRARAARAYIDSHPHDRLLAPVAHALACRGELQFALDASR